MSHQIKRSGLFELARKRVGVPMGDKRLKRNKEKESMLECECEQCGDKDCCEECQNYYCLCECHISGGKKLIHFLEDNDLDEEYWQDKLVSIPSPRSGFTLNLEFIGDDHYFVEEQKEDVIQWLKLTQKLLG